TSFTPELDPPATREVIFSGAPEHICFKVEVDNPSKDGYAPLYVTDNKGGGKMIELYYKKKVVTFKPDYPEDGYYPSYYGRHLIQQSTDSVVTVINLSGAGQEIPINSVKMKEGKEIKVVSTSRTIPTVLSSRDTMRITLRFTPLDTGYFSDTLSIVSDCFTKKYMLDGSGAVGLIVGADHNFEKLEVGKKSCWDTITVRNTGTQPFTLKEAFYLSDVTNFSFDPKSVRVGNRDYPLPLVIPVGDFVKLTICYHPTTIGDHSAQLILQTDIPSPYTTKPKNIIALKGRGLSSTKVPQELQLEEFRIHPNPTLGEDIKASFGLIEPKELRFTVYDMLGREVLSVPSSYFAKGKQSVTLPVSKLGEGGYILRVCDGVLTRSVSFRVVK
ncbi:MAG TPA: T9SS type A sorting domain-containing protein, partial [Candidatus Kapabacteria bacterium]